LYSFGVDAVDKLTNWQSMHILNESIRHEQVCGRKRLPNAFGFQYIQVIERDVYNDNSTVYR
jgi:hypothetical protein